LKQRAQIRIRETVNVSKERIYKATLTSIASFWDLLRFSLKNSFRGPDIFHASSPKPQDVSAAVKIKSLKGRELTDRNAIYSRIMVDKPHNYKINKPSMKDAVSKNGTIFYLERICIMSTTVA